MSMIRLHRQGLPQSKLTRFSQEESVLNMKSAWPIRGKKASVDHCLCFVKLYCRTCYGKIEKLLRERETGGKFLGYCSRGVL